MARDEFYERLDAATDYERLVVHLYGEARKAGAELWLKDPRDGTPEDKFSVNLVTGQWRNHKNGTGGSMVALIKATHPGQWKDEWANACPAAADVLFPNRRSQSSHTARPAAPNPGAKSDKKPNLFNKWDKARRRQTLTDMDPYAEAYGVTREHLLNIGCTTAKGGHLGPIPRLWIPAYDPPSGAVWGLKARMLEPKIPTKSGPVKSKNEFGTKASLMGWIANDRRPVILTEGEKEYILFSFLFPEFQVLSNTNGCDCWQPDWTTYVAGRPVVIIYDNDDAGNKANRKVAGVLKDHCPSVKIARIGDASTDPFDWARAHTKEELRALIDSAGEYDPFVSAGETDAYIRSICQQDKLEPEEVGGLLFQAMQDAGAFFMHQDEHLRYCVWRGRVYQVDRRNPFWSDLVYRYTLQGPESSPGRRCHARLRDLSVTRGASIESTTWFARRDDRLYLPLYSEDQTILEIGPDRINVVPNGHNGVVLLPDKQARPVNYLDDARYDPEAAEAAWNRIFARLNTASEWRDLVSAAVIVLPFYSFCGTRPLLRFQGDTGSGKSFATKVMTTLLFGREENQGGDTMASLYRMAGCRMLLALDNLEDTNLRRSPDLRDLLLRSCSGTTRMKSSGEDETSVIIQRVNCWIASTGKSPIGVGYEDMEERLVVVPVGGNFIEGFGETEELEWLVSHRDLLYSYWVRRVQDTFRRVLAGRDRTVRRKLDSRQRPRLHEWYSMLSVALWEEDRPHPSAVKWLESAYEGEKDSVIESDPVITLLTRLPAFFKDDNMSRGYEQIDYRIQGEEFEVTLHGHTLYAILSRIARELGLRMHTPTPKSLGYHLRSLSRRAGEYGVHLELRSGHTNIPNTGKRARPWNIRIAKDVIVAATGRVEDAYLGFGESSEQGQDSGRDGSGSDLRRERADGGHDSEPTEEEEEEEYSSRHYEDDFGQGSVPQDDSGSEDIPF